MRAKHLKNNIDNALDDMGNWVDGYYGEGYAEKEATVRQTVAAMYLRINDFLKILEDCLEREYNSFEPDNQSAHYHHIKEIINKEKDY